ncbi:MAG: SpoIIE family protein phosphatase, partial [Terracidiphilus sp.]
MVLAALILAAAPTHAQEPIVLRLPWNQWQLHIGDEPSCSQFQAPACTDQEFNHSDLIPLNHWRRIELTLPAELQSAPQLGILVQGEQPIYEVFVNGQLIGGSGSLASRQGPEYSRTILAIPSSLSHQGRLLIAIHDLGIRFAIPVPGFVPTLAPMDRIETVRDLDLFAYLRASWQHYLCYAAMFGAGFIFFLLFSVNTRLHEYFWLGARLCALAVYRIFELGWVVHLALPAWFTLAADRILNASAAFFLIQFVFAFLGRPVPKAFRAIQILGFSSAVSLLILFPWPSSIYFPLAAFIENGFFHRAMQIATVMGDLSLLLLVPGCFKTKLAEMRWIGAALVFIAFIETNRILGQFDLPSFPQDFMWGSLDFDLRPLAYLLFSIVMLIAMTFRLRRIQNRNREVEQEIAAARSIQQILIPDQLPSIPGLRIESAYLPAQEVGGDFFQILPIPNSADPTRPSAFIVLGDVSGKGLKAAMTVSLLVGTMRALAESCHSPGALLQGLSRLLYGRADGFATCLAFMVTHNGMLTLANAGHPNPYLNGIEIHTEANLPLGLSLTVTYSEISVQFDGSDRFTLVTDGVVEATSATTRELFGFDRTQSISTQPA